RQEGLEHGTDRQHAGVLRRRRTADDHRRPRRRRSPRRRSTVLRGRWDVLGRPSRRGVTRTRRRTTPLAAASVMVRRIALASGQRRSNRSRFMTLSHAATKSLTKRASPSTEAYTSARARSWEWAPKTRSTAVAVPVTAPEPSYTLASDDEVFHSVPGVSSLTK